VLALFHPVKAVSGALLRAERHWQRLSVIGANRESLLQSVVLLRIEPCAVREHDAGDAKQIGDCSQSAPMGMTTGAQAAVSSSASGVALRPEPSVVHAVLVACSSGWPWR
jgi:hypothetical protein